MAAIINLHRMVENSLRAGPFFKPFELPSSRRRSAASSALPGPQVGNRWTLKHGAGPP